MKRILLLILTLVLGTGVFPARADALDSGLVEDAGQGDRHALHKVFLHSMAERGGAASGAYENQLRQIVAALGTGPFTAALRGEPRQVQRRVLVFLADAMGGR